MIQVENLVKHYGPHAAVAGISFGVDRGEVVGFLGPNGAGKTTTLRVLTGYHPATSGTARIDGLDVFRQSLQVRARIGYLPENVPLYPDMRVIEYLRFRARLKGVPRDRLRSHVEQAIERCGVAEVRRKLIGHVSRGYRQRVGLADALVANPPCLILDEPTTGLDPNQRLKMKELIRELAREHTILFSSHILSEVEAVSSRILIIDHGVIRADGTPAELLEAAQRGRSVWLTVAADPAAVLTLFAGLPGVEAPAVAVEGLRADGFVTVSAAVAPGCDPRDELARRLRAQDLQLRELKLLSPSLEDLFHQLTTTADELVAAEEPST